MTDLPTESEESARQRGLTITHRVDELDQVEHYHVIRSRSLTGRAIIDIFTEKGDPLHMSDSVNVLIHTEDKLFLDRDQIRDIYLQERRRIPPSVRCTWGHVAPRKGTYYNYIFRADTADIFAVYEHDPQYVTTHFKKGTPPE